jgi:hypothetical protein
LATRPESIKKQMVVYLVDSVRRIVCVYQLLLSRKSKVRDIHVDIHKIFDMLLPIILGKGQLNKSK